VLFVDVPRKVNNPDYEEIGVEPFEVGIREQIGALLGTSQLNELKDIILSMGLPPKPKNIFNIGQSSAVASKFIMGYIQNDET